MSETEKEKPVRMLHFATSEHVRFHNAPFGFANHATRWTYPDAIVVWEHGTEQWRFENGVWKEYHRGDWNPCNAPELEWQWLKMKGRLK